VLCINPSQFPSKLHPNSLALYTKYEAGDGDGVADIDGLIGGVALIVVVGVGDTS
jgi:hypothetical protein